MSTSVDPSGPSNFTFGGNFTLAPNMTIWGPIPDDHRRSLQVDMIVCATITWVIALILVVLRLYTRCRIIKVFGPSDWCIAFSVLFAAGDSISTIEQAVRGNGKHSWELDPNQISPIARVRPVFPCLYV